MCITILSLYGCFEAEEPGSDGDLELQEQEQFELYRGNEDGDLDEEIDGDVERSELDSPDHPPADGDLDGLPDSTLAAGFVLIEAGVFWMGSPNNEEVCPEAYPPGECMREPGRDIDEKLHEVELTSDFYLQTHEVTQEDFETLMGWNPSHFSPAGTGVDCVGACPVESMSWFDALAYANRFSLYNGWTPCYEFSKVQCKDGSAVGSKPMTCMNSSRGGVNSATVGLSAVSTVQDCDGYRLPTEAEWEFAIRSFSNTAFSPTEESDGVITDTGSDPSLDLIGWYYYNSDIGSGRMTHSAGLKAANAFGLFDMSGNVWELVWDRYCSDYESYPATDPDGSTCNASFRVKRGGGWFDTAQNCRSAVRDGVSPSERDNDSGFRLAKSILKTDPDGDAETDDETLTDGDVIEDGDNPVDGDLEGGEADEEASSDFVFIEAGSFWMGSPNNEDPCPEGYPLGNCEQELGREEDEVLHEVELTIDFEMQKHEVTQAEFEGLTGWNPSWFGPNRNGVDCGGDCPIESVNWYESLVYLNELSSLTELPKCYVLANVICEDGTEVDLQYEECLNDDKRGIYFADVLLNHVSRPQDCIGYRLPTEAEWEYSARAGSNTAFYPSEGNDGSITETGNDPNLNQIAWYEFNSDTGQNETPHPVGGKEPNAWGLYDMLGNVNEWLWDFYCIDNITGYGVDPDGSACVGAEDRNLRGGFWSSFARRCRIANRNNAFPRGRYNYLGLRVARTVF